LTARRSLLGMLTPSSNTVLEPVTSRMLEAVPHASAHFGRFRVTQIALSDDANAQFAQAEIMRAVDLLADAKCQVIGWNGTSASWLGFHSDEALCTAIEAAGSARACTSVLAMNEVLARTGARRIGLVTPYTADVQACIITNYAAIGIDVVAQTHWGLRDNFSFSTVTEAMIAAAVRAAADAKPDAIVILCTNLRGAPLVPALEAELDIPVYDSIATVVWKSLLLCDDDPRALAGWGRLFSVAA
jgi:maleate isomerase